MLSITVVAIGAVALLLPTLVGFTVAIVALWFGITTGIRAWVQAMRARSEEREAEQKTIESGVSES
jgi:biopolymer transport protein ExbB/TolQ